MLASWRAPTLHVMNRAGRSGKVEAGVRSRSGAARPGAPLATTPRLSTLYGVAPGEDLAAARAQFAAAVGSVCADDPWFAEHPPEGVWWGGQFLPARTDVDDPLVGSGLGAARATRGDGVELRGMPYGCDMGLTVGVAGIPTVVCGPGDIRDAHVPDESVPVADLVASARTIALTALRFCGTA